MGRIIGLLCFAAFSHAATFGTAVPVRGTVSDIALDERRGVLYLADFSAGRIQVLRTADLTFANPLPPLAAPASALALSPDGRYLVVGRYERYSDSPGQPGVTVFDLDNGTRQYLSVPDPVLAVAFGAGTQALLVTAGEFRLLDPVAARTQPLGTNLLACRSLPVPLGTFPPSITWASAGVSGDGQTIIVLAKTDNPPPQCGPQPQEPSPTDASYEALIRYRIGTGQIEVLEWTFTPQFGPRAVSINADASAFLAGWALFDAQARLLAQFPYPVGNLRLGGVAFDSARNVIYADIPVDAKESPVLHLVDTDNLTVRERIRLPQAMAGRSIFSSDGQTLYTVSDSGILVFRLGSLAAAPRVVASKEDLLFQGGSCSPNALSQTLDLVDPSGGNVDFILSLDQPAGIRLSAASGTTPATIRIDVDPTVFHSPGTTVVNLNIATAQGINLPLPVRLLINTGQVDQRGRLVQVPGKIVDLLPDPARNRVYLIRQDKNLVLVYDAATFQPIASLRTGNTPVGMAMTIDQRYLLVGNDNSQLASVFDLDTLQPSSPVWFPNAYPRTLAAAYGAIWATTRVPDPLAQGLYRVDFTHRIASRPPSLGVYCNNRIPGQCDTPVPPEAVVVASPYALSILLAIPDGSVALWDSSIERWVVSRHDFTALSGAYGALGENWFVVDQHLLDTSLYPTLDFESQSGASSGIAPAGTFGLRTTAAAGAGTIERIDLASFETYHATPTFETPITAACR